LITLSIESSAKAASVALTRENHLLAQYFQDSGLTHSRTLLQMVEDVLKNNGLAVRDLARIAVARGPGSFTGIRIGVAAAKGLAWGAQLPVRAVSTLRAAVSVFGDEGVVLCPVMDARRGETYNALFERRGGALTRLCPDRAIPAEALAGEAKKSVRPYLLTGDGAELVREVFKKSGAPFLFAPDLLRLQCAYGVALAAQGEPDADAGSVVPNYLRVSQAEREKNEKSGRP
jgi:tRNA threonylcarbamoyladenosine biosynthesis protein TsaB